jgi:hypothetical protein
MSTRIFNNSNYNGEICVRIEYGSSSCYDYVIISSAGYIYVGYEDGRNGGIYLSPSIYDEQLYIKKVYKYLYEAKMKSKKYFDAIKNNVCDKIFKNIGSIQISDFDSNEIGIGIDGKLYELRN